jgi:hypothetical protein
MWDVIRTEDGEVHVVPQDAPHVLSSECGCKPDRDSEDENIWVHHAITPA